MGQAELYSAIAGNKAVIPAVISPTRISALDEPLQCLLRDTQYVTITGAPTALDGGEPAEPQSVAAREDIPS